MTWSWFAHCLILTLASSNVIGASNILGDDRDNQNFVAGEPLTEEEFNSKAVVLPDISDDVKHFHLCHYDILHLDSKNAMINEYGLWPNGEVPYVISADYTSTQRKFIAQAMFDYHTYTCIRFVPWTNETNYVIIKKTGTGCNAHVGMKFGASTISLDDECVRSKITPIHELMHVIGFFHEQSRYDRDDYVTIHWSNVIPDYTINFYAYGPETIRLLGTTYDYESVMHYTAYAFAIDSSRPTITRKSGSTALSNDSGLSKSDILKINRLYGCNSNDTCWDEEVRTCPPLFSCGPFYCDAHPDVMMAKCKKSCNFCSLPDLTPEADPNCADYISNCDVWANMGQCNSDFMDYYCRKACKLCTPSRCKNLYIDCNAWAQQGDCQSNASFMNTFCQKACNTCILY